MSERRAVLIWDGTAKVCVPEAMGAPRADQMVGTTAERLGELAGRTCYDSLGSGRASADYHKHLLDVGHLSVHEHWHATVEMSLFRGDDAMAAAARILTPSSLDRACAMRSLPYTFLNRPGVWIRPGDYQSSAINLRVTVNPRVVAEWDRWTAESGFYIGATAIGRAILDVIKPLAPQVLRETVAYPHEDIRISARVVEPEDDHEKWVSLWLTGSRGWSHEQVRHGDETAISQRSTRYVDESESPWIEHPLTSAFLAAWAIDHSLLHRRPHHENSFRAIEAGRSAYTHLVAAMQTWLLTRGVDKLTARKQARGAARGYLGNALATEMIFSASVAEWRHIIRMRCADAADAEIRAVMCDALGALKLSRYGDRFADIELAPSSDGLGMSVKGGGSR